ncbi:hypothetical protein [Saccharopolyspora gloriosae]|uniref:hypothetical protein n=1 Tax=Saccharopolyspora gloriosae TaxID=455344 RepID=UPI001FB7658E|nr:hypothetical protein [Saccharopolyspora gloriosae]
MPDGFQVDLTALDQTGQAISQTIEDMGSKPLGDIDGPSGDYGHAGVHASFKHFCDRWEKALNTLIDDGDTLVQALNASMDSYVEADHAAVQSMRSVGAGSDPAQDAADG